MTRRGPRHRRTTVLAGALLLTTGLLTTGLLGATAPGPAGAAAPERQEKVRDRAGQLLDEPVGGRAALVELGDDLALAAARNDLATGELRTLLRTDPTARLDTDARLFYVDPAPTAAQLAGTDDDAPRATAPLADTFSLHSNPGSTLKIYLDVDGQSVSGTAWDATLGGAGTSHPAWDPARDGAGFSDGERTRVQAIWAMVAEDYAAFDVDVTTQDPGQAGLVRSGPDDTSYGVRALVSPSTDAAGRICDSACGGIAYVGVFADGDGYYQPAWVFPHLLGDDVKNIAEATSHEVGHNLALGHDGTAAVGYYTGHGSWAPIMGVGYDRPVVQWSNGDYTGASNHQDDVAVIDSYLGRRTDEAGSGPATAAVLPADGTTSVIDDRTDVDTFLLGRCTAGTAVTVGQAYGAADLDSQATLVDAATGTVVTTDDPVSATVDRGTASGMGARVSVSTTGRYLLQVDGVGNGTPATGYDDYASIGGYTVTAPGCDRDVAVPGTPTDLTAEPVDDTTARVGWSAPTTGAAVTGYRVSLGDQAPVTVGPQMRSHTFTGLTRGAAYTVAVSAVGADGAGVPASTTFRQAVVPSNDDADAATVLQGGSGTVSGDNLFATAADDDPYPPTEYTGAGGLSVWYSWTPSVSGTATLATQHPSAGRDTTLGVYTGSRGGLELAAGNDDAGNSLLSRVSLRVTAGTRYLVAVDGFPETADGSGAFDLVWKLTPDAPDSPTDVTASAGDRTVDVGWAWTGDPADSFTVTAAPGGRAVTVDGSARRTTVDGLTNGTSYTFSVTATAAAGTSEPSTATAAVVPAGAPLAAPRPTATVQGRKVIVSWAAAGPNGSPVTGYDVLVSGEPARSVAGDKRRTVVRGVALGRHQVRVVATNARGSAVSPSTRFKVR